MTVDAVVERLLAARDDGRAIAPPSSTVPFSLFEGYRAQDGLREALVARGERVAGWKVGFTTTAAQAAFGCAEPVSGFLLASGVAPTGVTLPRAAFGALVVEAEVALVLGRNLAGRDVTVPAAALAVDGAAAALELVDRRYTSRGTAADVVADAVHAAKIVLGNALIPLRTIDLALEGVVFEHNGAIVATSTAAEGLGGPLNALVWLVRHLAGRNLGLWAGDIVMTGSISALLKPVAGDSVQARFTRLGTVAARFV